NAAARPVLDVAATLWMTPNVPNGGRTASHAIPKGNHLVREDGTKIQLGLEHQAKVWPTPAARDFRSDHGRQTDEELYGTKGRPLAANQPGLIGAATAFPHSLRVQPIPGGKQSSGSILSLRQRARAMTDSSTRSAMLAFLRMVIRSRVK